MGKLLVEKERRDLCIIRPIMVHSTSRLELSLSLASQLSNGS